MNRKLWPYLVLAFVSLAGALWVSLRSAKPERLGEAWASFEAPSLVGIRLEAQDKSTDLKPLGLTMAWVRTAEKGKLTGEFLAGESMRDVFFSLSPMWASRVLGEVSEKKGRDYGFGDSSKLLRISTLGSGVRDFRVGNRGFKSSDYFIYDPSRKQAFLWQRDTIDSLMNPSRLAMRELRFFNPDGLNRAKIVDPAEAQPMRDIVKLRKLWQEGETPLAVDDPVLGWLEGLAKVSIRGYKLRPDKGLKPILHIILEIESSLNLTLVHEEASASYYLDFGTGHVLVLLDGKALEPLLKAWREGSIHRKS